MAIRPDLEASSPRGPEPWSEQDFRLIESVLKAQLGHAISAQRLGLIRSRLQVRLQSRGIPSFSWFHERVLRARPGGLDMQMLIDLSTINHSMFFREPRSLRFMAERLAERMRLGPVRVWSAGCAAGQEPYSLAMTLAELVPPTSLLGVEIHGSDLSSEMIRDASKAIYSARELAEVVPERLRRFFLRGLGPRMGKYRVVPEIRKLVRFWQFDLRAASWPIPGEFDAIFCRNVSIYFDEDRRLHLIDRLAERLNDGGWLLLGHCEILPGPPTRLLKVGPSLYRKEPM